MIEPIPQAEEVDVSDLSNQKLTVSINGGGAAAALADRGFWPIWQSNSLATQRSFIDDMASLNTPHRPYW